MDHDACFFIFTGKSMKIKSAYMIHSFQSKLRQCVKWASLRFHFYYEANRKTRCLRDTPNLFEMPTRYKFHFRLNIELVPSCYTSMELSGDYFPFPHRVYCLIVIIDPSLQILLGRKCLSLIRSWCTCTGCIKYLIILWAKFFFNVCMQIYFLKFRWHPPWKKYKKFKKCNCRFLQHCLKYFAVLN